MVPENRISFQLILTIVVVALSSVGRGDEVRWIEGQSYPHPWSIELTQPIERETVSSQPVYFVDANATGTSTGLSWGNAFTDLQSALGIAVPGSEIRVARGIYRPQPVIEGQHTNPNATFKLGPGVVLKGGYAGLRGADPNGQDVAQYETILSGDLAGDDKPVPRLADLISDLHRADNAYHVVTLSETDSSSVLDGFTITGGVAIDTNLPDKPGCGGGIYNDGGSATVHNCKIFGNAADYHGGGIYTSGPGSPTFATCMVAENWAQWTGGAMYAQWSGTVTISQCVVTGNGAQYNGGAISAQSDAELLISNCILSGNMAAEPVAGGGGALYSLLANVRLSNCTIVGNTAAVGTALVCEGAGSPGRNGVYLGNCIVWGEGEVLSTEEQSGLEVVYSDVRGGWPGQGNIDADPCFVDPGYWDNASTEQDTSDDTWIGGDYHLTAASACIEAGSVGALTDANGTDLDGQPRLSGFAPDMGAYEVQNDLPVADAGPDVATVALDGVKASVTLDAGRSYDPEGQPLQYRWYKGSDLVSEQARFTTVLPPGEYNFRLVVTDPMGFTGSDEVKVTISWTLNVDLMVSPQVIDRDSSKAITAIIVLPKGISPKDVDLSQPLVLSPGNVRAKKQQAILWLSGHAVVLADFPRAGLVAAVPQNGSVELQIVGRLKDGQQFSGRDTVTIK